MEEDAPSISSFAEGEGDGIGDDLRDTALTLQFECLLQSGVGIHFSIAPATVPACVVALAGEGVTARGGANDLHELFVGHLGKCLQPEGNDARHDGA